MSAESLGLVLVWGGAALSVVLAVHTLLASESDLRVRALALAVFVMAVAASLLLGRPRGHALAAPISATFFSVVLLLVVTLIEGVHLRGRH